MNMGRVADRVAADLRRNLEARAGDLEEVYAFCLYADDLSGDFLASIATEAEFARQALFPAQAGKSAQELRAWSGPRWDIGGWHKFPEDEFISTETELLLAPVVSRLNDDAISDAKRERRSASWRELAFDVIGRCQPLSLLPCTADAIAFANFPDLHVAQEVDAMVRTVPAQQLKRLFPDLQIPG